MSKKLEEPKAFAEKINSIRKPLLGAPYGIFWSSGNISLNATLEELNQVSTTKQPLNRRILSS